MLFFVCLFDGRWLLPGCEGSRRGRTVWPWLTPAKLSDGPEVGVQRVFPVDVVCEGHGDCHSSECSPF